MLAINTHIGASHLALQTYMQRSVSQPFRLRVIVSPMASSGNNVEPPVNPLLASFGLSDQQTQGLVPFLNGFDAGQLADVIWDALMGVGFDDVVEGFGLFFSGDGLQADADSVSLGGAVGRNSVFYWDTQGTMKLPQKAFLQVMELIAVHTLSNPPPPSASGAEAEEEFDEVKIVKEEANRSRLRIALRVLQKKLKDSTVPFPSSLSHQCSLDSGFQDTSNTATLIQQAQCRWHPGRGAGRRGSLPVSSEGSVRRGFEGVLQGRPLPREKRRGSLNERVLAKLAAVKSLNPGRRLSSVTEDELQPQHAGEDLLEWKLNSAEEGSSQGNS